VDLVKTQSDGVPAITITALPNGYAEMKVAATPKSLPASYYADFLSDQAKERKPSPSASIEPSPPMNGR